MISDIIFVSSHPVSADHFSALVHVLKQKEIPCEIFARGAALKKFQERDFQVLPFNELNEIYDRCSSAKVVITELCDGEMEVIHQGLPSEVRKYAYYDNSQSFVSLEYGQSAEKAIRAAGAVIFANGNLETFEISPGVSFNTQGIQVCSLGYYPLEKVEEFIKLRKQYAEKIQENPKIVFFGAATHEYKNAFPKILEALQAAKEEFPAYEFLLQPHPRSTVEKETELPVGISISTIPFEEAVVSCKQALYFQTGDAPKIALAGIPIVHVAPEINQHDLLVQNKACQVAVNGSQLVHQLKNPEPLNDDQKAIVKYALGYRETWPNILIQALQND